jgi:hypothetical protein
VDPEQGPKRVVFHSDKMKLPFTFNTGTNPEFVGMGAVQRSGAIVAVPGLGWATSPIHPDMIFGKHRDLL